ncbi:head-tail adaptor protein [Bosea thiooxidans]
MASPKRRGAGSLNQLCAFQVKAAGEDEYGNVTVGAWTTQFTEPCRLMAKLGGEGVFAGRLQGTQPFIMTVRSSTRTRGVDGTWRAVNARTGETYNIKTNVNVDERNAYLELLVVAGEAS